MKVYTFLTDGFETVEALAVIDILRTSSFAPHFKESRH